MVVKLVCKPLTAFVKVPHFFLFGTLRLCLGQICNQENRSTDLVLALIFCSLSPKRVPAQTPIVVLTAQSKSAVMELKVTSRLDTHVYANVFVLKHEFYFSGYVREFESSCCYTKR